MSAIEIAADTNQGIRTLIRLAKTAGFDLDSTRRVMTTRVRTAWTAENEATYLASICRQLRVLGLDEHEAAEVLERAITNYWADV